MSSQIEKIIGYVLVCIGLFCILFAFSSIYDVFTEAKKPLEIFRMQSLEVTINPTGIVKEAMPMTIPIDSEIRKLVNMILHYLFMAFVVMVGSKLGSMGILFIKDIKVKGPAS